MGGDDDGWLGDWLTDVGAALWCSFVYKGLEKASREPVALKRIILDEQRGAGARQEGVRQPDRQAAREAVGC